MAGYLPHIVYPVMSRIVGVFVIALALSQPAFAKKPPVGDMAPDFTLPTNGKYNLRLSEQRGYIHVIVFWASWCRSCPVQLDSLNTLQEKYREFGVNVWAITLDKTREAAHHYLTHKQMDFTILYDTAFEVSERYDIDDLPSSLIVDRDGRIRHIQDGFEPTDIDKYDAILQKLVRE
ncbi:MAG: TlpA family protein disulfide reductase [Pseudomonadales bacterium]|nr:TlpA family protein disulfide reductase [Pseudomonadales bacterium]